MSTVASAAVKAASAAPALRQFPFFVLQSIKDVNNSQATPEIFKLTPEISAVASSSAGILVADVHGSLHALNHGFEPYMSWVAHSNGQVTHMAERKGKLVTLGEEEDVKSPLLKIWDLEKTDKVTGTPTLLRSVKVHVKDNNRPHPVSTIALASDIQALAIGLADGTVLLYKYVNQSLQSPSHSLTALRKPIVVHHDSQPGEPITGLGFREPSSAVDVNEDDMDPYNANLFLFIVTTSQVMHFQVTGQTSSSNRATTVDEIGSALHCSEMDVWRGKEIVIAREEAIYLVGLDGRGTCFAYEGRKTSIHTHANYLVIVSPPLTATSASASATVRNFVARAFHHGPDRETDLTKLTVLDLENKIVAYSGAFTQGVCEIVSQWDKLYIVGNDGSLSCLDELPTSQKLDLLYAKSQYTLALSLARTQRLEETHISEIHRRYGDHLYSTGKYDAAINEFVLTIGNLQPSYVIRKFLDSQRIHNLVTYLQELHNLGLANSDHTTLLLNTYTKLKDISRLDSFIKTEAKRSTARTAIHRMQGGDTSVHDELPFDLETAIRVCRQAGYFDHAGWLAKKYERHAEYLRILIEDAGRYLDALAYMRKLGVDTAENNLARYGRALLEQLPSETTRLFIDLCTTNTSTLPQEEVSPKEATSTPQTGGAPSYLSYLAIKNPIAISQPVSVQASSTSSPSHESVIDLPTTTLPSAEGDTPGVDTQTVALDSGSQHTVTQKPRAPVKRISPTVYFAHFVDHMEPFVIFLETVAWRRWGQSVEPDVLSSQQPPSTDSPPAEDPLDKRDQVAVWNTLLELYLTLSTSSDDEAVRTELHKKAMRVLESNEIPYDSTHALILCSTRDYTEGLVLLWEKMEMYEDVVRFFIDRDLEEGDPHAAGKVVEYLKLYGDKPGQKQLWPLVLRYLTSSAELLARRQDDVKMILEHVDREGIIPPLGVVQLLSRNDVATVGLIKQWLMGKIEEARTEINADEEWISSYRLETATKQKQVAELSDPEHPALIHATRCSACGGALDLPTIHFMCHHSYHARCVADNETDCPNCARDHGVIREMRRNNEWLTGQHDLFLSEVKDGGGFDAIANAFSRGFLSIPKTEV